MITGILQIRPVEIRPVLRYISALLVLLIGGTLMAGCDFSAKWDLRQAEKMLQEAEKYNAEWWAEPEYKRAQKAFEEAMDNSRARNVNEARDLAELARSWAEVARDLSRTRYLEMEEEKQRLLTTE